MTHVFRDKSADSNNFNSKTLLNTLSNYTNVNNSNQANSATLNFALKNANLKSKTPQTTTNQNTNSSLNKNTLVNLLDSLNLNKNVSYKDEGSVLFRKKIDKLNLKFYVETDKYLHNQNDMDKCQDQLFIILFKQITLYSEEVERLNTMIRDFYLQNNININNINNINNISINNTNTSSNNTSNKEDKKDSKASTTTNIPNLITTLKKNNYDLNNEVSEKNNDIKQLKSEIDSLKRQVKFFKDKLQLDLNNNSNLYSINTTMTNITSENLTNKNSNTKDLKIKGTLIDNINNNFNSSSTSHSNSKVNKFNNNINNSNINNNASISMNLSHSHFNSNKKALGSLITSNNPYHKKNISSDKLLGSITTTNNNDSMSKLSYKPTLSMSNFNKKPQKNSLSVISNNNSNNLLSCSVNVSSSALLNNISQSPAIGNTPTAEYSLKTSNNLENSIISKPLITASKTVVMKKRNYSDNDPNSTLNQKGISINSTSINNKEGRERNEFMKSKLNIQEVVKLNNANSSSSKKPLFVSNPKSEVKKEKEIKQIKLKITNTQGKHIISNNYVNKTTTKCNSKLNTKYSYSNNYSNPHTINKLNFTNTNTPTNTVYNHNYNKTISLINTNTNNNTIVIPNSFNINHNIKYSDNSNLLYSLKSPTNNNGQANSNSNLLTKDKDKESNKIIVEEFNNTFSNFNINRDKDKERIFDKESKEPNSLSNKDLKENTTNNTNTTNNKELKDKDNSSLFDESLSTSIVSYLDSEINEITEMEIILKKLKMLDDLKVAFSSSNEAKNNSANSNNKNGSNSKSTSTSDYLRKKYQMLNSVTIDLINNTSSSVVDRSKSKKK